jgi:hypothetical protein
MGPPDTESRHAGSTRLSASGSPKPGSEGLGPASPNPGSGHAGAGAPDPGSANMDAGASRRVTDGLARLNDALGAGLSFSVELPRKAAFLPWGRGATASDADLRSAVLIARQPGGPARCARCVLAAPAADARAFLLSVATSVGECAMRLGLGTGVYRRRLTAEPPVRAALARGAAVPADE